MVYREWICREKERKQEEQVMIVLARVGQSPGTEDMGKN